MQSTNLKGPIEKPLTEDEIFVENVMTELNNEKGLLADHIQKNNRDIIELDSELEEASDHNYGEDSGGDQ